jgi:hypothetical protein
LTQKGSCPATCRHGLLSDRLPERTTLPADRSSPKRGGFALAKAFCRECPVITDAAGLTSYLCLGNQIAVAVD